MEYRRPPFEGRPLTRNTRPLAREERVPTHIRQFVNRRMRIHAEVYTMNIKNAALDKVVEMQKAGRTPDEIIETLVAMIPITDPNYPKRQGA